MAWKFYGDDAIVTPLVFGGDYRNFKQCYERQLKSKMEQDKTGKFDFVKKFFDNGGFDLIKILEENLEDCGSICTVPLFRMTIDTTKGRPSQECLEPAM